MKTVYIIGKMRGRKLYGWNEFKAAEYELRANGWRVINPHTEDKAAGFDVHLYQIENNIIDWCQYPPGFDVAACRERNRRNVERADAIFVLKGGLGTLREFEHAILMGKPVFHEEGGYPSPDDMAENGSGMAQETISATKPTHGGGSPSICARCHGKTKDSCGFGGLPEGKDRCSLFVPLTATGVKVSSPDINDTIKQAAEEIRSDHRSKEEKDIDQAIVDYDRRQMEKSQDEMKKAFGIPTETRVTDPDTGGMKGAKPEQLDQIPPVALLELARHYGKGAAKYDAHNFRKGYKWSLSYNALQRHLLQFWAGEDLDQETKSKHVIAAAWHCLCLATFMDEHRNKDDRYKREATP